MRRRVPFLFSVRFGITAWYAGVLILTIALMGFAFRMLLVDALEDAAYDRLRGAAQDVLAATTQRTGIDQDAENQNARNVQLVPDVNLDSVLITGLTVSVYGSTDLDVAVFTEGPQSDIWPTEEVLQDYIGRRQPTFETVRVDGYSIRSYTRPIMSRDDDPRTGEPTVLGTIFISESLSMTNRMLVELNRVLLISGIFGAVVASAGGWVLAGRALAPVNRIMSSADDIAKDRSAASLSRRLDVPPTGDEIAQLAETFNDMLDRIEHAFVAQRRFVADASHELRTPLTSIKGNIDVLRRQIASGRMPRPADIDEALEDVARESSRMSRLVEDLLALARNEAQGYAMTTQMSLLSLDELAREAARSAEGLLKGQSFRLEASRPVEVYGNGDQLIQVMLILLDNAIRHTPRNGDITLRVSSDIDPDDDLECARIDVEDTGCGIEQDHLPHLFERFYRAEGSRDRHSGGTGLGLSIALSIVRAHSGWIDVESAPDAGTHFTVWIPLPRQHPNGDDRGNARLMPKVPRRKPVSKQA